jgi:hypothetical protein
MEENYGNITKTVIAERLSQRSIAMSRRSIHSAKKQGPGVETKKSSFMLKMGKYGREDSASPSLKKGDMSTPHQAMGNRSHFSNIGALKTPIYSQRGVIRGDRKFSRTEKNSRDSSDDSSAQKSNGSFGKKVIQTRVLTKSHSDLSGFYIGGIPREGTLDIPISPLQSHDNQSIAHDRTLSSFNKLSGGV